MNRGSEWRIWDLHVHTPFSLEHSYKCSPNEDIWEKYIDALEHLPDDIKVLGINDYLFIDGYRKILSYKERGRLQNIDLILPVVEFRLSKFCGNEKFKRINYHIIFSNDLTPDQIQQQFLNALTAHYTLSPDCTQQWGGVISMDSIKDLGERIINSVPEDKRKHYGNPLREGFNNLNLETSVIKNALSNANQIFDGKFITAIGKTEWEDFKWNDNSIAEKKNIINDVDIVFTAAENIEAYNRSKEKLHEQGVNDLLLDCSDAHSFADQIELKDRLGNCKTWIKADTTFEGLKQILFEPEDRVRIQTTKPDEKNIYQVIDSITLDEDEFWHGNIFLNPNLNTIVGGRSTGKSSLLKAIAAKHGNKEVEDNDFIRQHLNGISIRWQDGNDQLGREIEYFRQSYMHDIAFDSEKTNRIVDNIIKDKDEAGLLKAYNEHLAEISKKISEDVFSIFQMQKDIVSLTKSLSEKGNKDGVVKQLNLLKSKAADLQKGSELSPEERMSFDAYLHQIQEKKKQIAEADNDLGLLNKMKNVTPFETTFKDKWQFNQLSFPLNQYDIDRLYDDLKVKTETEWGNIVQQFIEKTSKAKEQISTDIQTIMAYDVYKKGIHAFEGNKELKDINGKIIEEEKNLETINGLQSRFEHIRKLRNSLIQKIIDAHCSYKIMAREICNTLEIAYDGLDISVSLTFHKKELQEFLESRLNLRGNERQEYLKTLLNRYDDDNKSYSIDFLKDLLLENILLKNGYEALNVAIEFFTRNWYSLDYSLTYQGDAFVNMSEGKQAFVILKLLLDFSDKKCPILIDQPEDSLDNRAIYHELVAYIKRKKKERQIILVTHNSNVVVSADAENVIVANQEGADTPNLGGLKFQYINGALEDTKQRDENAEYILSSQGIREHICDILEGGRVAFEKREQKYGFRR
ncbi:TrlF family AAA-like ATPase [Porphyromonas gulae]|uniref:DNA repair protein n=1 Tax=Porphyromonas gulae TaxID=111105 RepID=A0A0A2F5B3_9PORP|nr:ATP-binding protein [Porphyromonas gulae]KGN85232.1 DNA repair protein [Porphyromonas gulae]